MIKKKGVKRISGEEAINEQLRLVSYRKINLFFLLMTISYLEI